MWTLRVLLLVSQTIILPTLAGFTDSPSSKLDGRDVPTGNGFPICQLKSQPPSDAICGVHGYLAKKGFVFGKQTYPNRELCQESCLNASGNSSRTSPSAHYFSCQAFSYDSSSRSCVLYANSLKNRNFTESGKGSPLFYDQTCFDCPHQCPSRSKVNLVKNGGFEISNTLAGPWYFVYPNHKGKVVTPGHHSPSAYMTTENGIKQSVRLCSNSVYYFKADVKLQLRNASLPYPYRTVGVSISEVEYYGKQTPGEWFTISASFITYINPDLTTVGPDNLVQFLTFDATVLYRYAILVDNVEIYPAEGLTSTVGPNLVANGGFDKGILSPWKISTDRQQELPASARYEVTAPGLSNSKYKFEFHQPVQIDAGFTLQQTIGTEVGKLYQFSFDIFNDPKLNHSQDTYPPQLEIKAGNYRWSSTGFLAPPLNQMYHFTRVFQAHSNSTRISLVCFTEQGLYPGSYGTRVMRTVADNFQVREVSGNIGVGSRVSTN